MNKVNEYGVPLHACNGHRHDEHWWAWAQWMIDNCKVIGRNDTHIFYEKPVQ